MENKLEQLAKLFLKLPGIGSRQAKRFAYFILSQPNEYVNLLAQTLKEARAHAQNCHSCLRIFEEERSNENHLCDICSDQNRDQSVLMIVEKSSDIDAFAKTDYKGLFFVLGSLIPIVQKDVLSGTNIKILSERIKEAKDLAEVILAFPITPNGEHTDQVIRETLAKYPVEINSLGRGLSTGTELEYADPASLSASLKKRE